MGGIVYAHCDCGYCTDWMYLGGGMKNHGTHCNFPHYCEECKILFEANLFERPILCPECGRRKVVSYNNKTLCEHKGRAIFEWHINGKTLELTNGKYICPDCGNFNLTFSGVGHCD
jgi:hypothetical protein